MPSQWPRCHSGRRVASQAATISAKTRVRFPAQVRDGFRLELVRRAHVEDLFQVVDRSRDHLARWLPWVRAVTGPEDTLAWVRRCQRLLAAGQEFTLVLVLDGAVVGTVGSDID